MFTIYRWIYNLMGFSRSQTNGFLIFLPILAIITFSEPIYRSIFLPGGIDHHVDAQKLDSLIASWAVKPISDKTSPVRTLPTKQNLDPNTASMTELIAIGLPQKLAGRIISYRSKGGRFNSITDLQKIYGMDSSILLNIRPYLAFSDYRRKKDDGPEVKTKLPMAPVSFRFDLNEADTIVLKRIRGIGDKLAVRIVRYRDALGGFTAIKQLNEIYRLDTLVVKEMKKHCFISPEFQPKKMDINSIDERGLADHPYLSPREAGAIVAYRFKHGKFTSIGDLYKVKVVDTTSIKRIIPYVNFGN